MRPYITVNMMVSKVQYLHWSTASGPSTQVQRKISLLTKSLFCLLFRLHFVFNQSLLHALDLIDQKKVIKLITTSGRVLYQVGKFCAKWNVESTSF